MRYLPKTRLVERVFGVFGIISTDDTSGHATALLGAGLTEHAVATLVGHGSAQEVYQRYGHALPDEVAHAASRLDAWREGRTGTVASS